MSNIIKFPAPAPKRRKSKSGGHTARIIESDGGYYVCDADKKPDTSLSPYPGFDHAVRALSEDASCCRESGEPVYYTHYINRSGARVRVPAYRLG